MSDLWRAISMFFIWGATAAIAITVIANESVFGGGNAWVIAPVVAAAVIATALVFFSKAIEARIAGRMVNAADLEKPKRAANADEKMRLLLEMMDDDERYAFKQAMKERMLSGSRDGELNYDADSLGALLDEDDSKRRRR